jgi:drug/metabolite transporter (DMT)-like permease
MYSNKTIPPPITKPPASSTPALLALVWVSIFWGTTYFAAKIGVQYTHGLYLAGIRQTVAGLLLVGFFMLRGYPLPDRKTLRRVSVIGLLMLLGSNGLMTWAMQYIPSGLGAIIAATVPLWITLFSMLLLGRSKLSGTLLLGLLVGFAGVAGIFYEHWADLFNPVFRFGIILTILACICWALGSVLSARWKPALTPLYGAGIQMLVGGVSMVGIAAGTGSELVFAAWNAELWITLIYLIVVGSILSYSAYVYALSKLPPPLVAVYAYVNPIVAVALGWFFLNEQFSGRTLISGLIAMTGVYLVNSSFQKK